MNLVHRLISHYSWLALEEGARPFILQMEKLSPRKVTFMPPRSPSQWVVERESDFQCGSLGSSLPASLPWRAVCALNKRPLMSIS